MMSGNVSQLGTLSFQPSITAATTIARQMKPSGQFSRVNNAMSYHPPHEDRRDRRRAPHAVELCLFAPLAPASGERGEHRNEKSRGAQGPAARFGLWPVRESTVI